MKVLGVSAEISYGSFDAVATELLAGRIDAIVTLIGAPMPAGAGRRSEESVTFISLSSEQIEAVRKAMPEDSASAFDAVDGSSTGT